MEQRASMLREASMLLCAILRAFAWHVVGPAERLLCSAKFAVTPGPRRRAVQRIWQAKAKGSKQAKKGGGKGWGKDGWGKDGWGGPPEMMEMMMAVMGKAKGKGFKGRVWAAGGGAAPGSSGGGVEQGGVGRAAPKSGESASESKGVGRGNRCGGAGLAGPGRARPIGSAGGPDPLGRATSGSAASERICADLRATPDFGAVFPDAPR